MWCVTRNSWLDFGSDPDHDADIGIFEEFYHCFIGAIKWILVINQKLLTNSYEISCTLECLANSKSSNFGADPDLNVDPSSS